MTATEKAFTFIFGIWFFFVDIVIGFRDYILDILIAIDQLGTTILGGYPDETLSCWAHRGYVKKTWFGWTRHIINALFFWQEDHCLSAYERERERKDVPPLFR